MRGRVDGDGREAILPLYVRQEGGRAWIYTESREVTVKIEAIRCDLRLEDVYAMV
jgi:hypothetical protein